MEIKMPDINITPESIKENEGLRINSFLQSFNGRDWLKEELGEDDYQAYLSSEGLVYEQVRSQVEKIVSEAKEDSSSELALAAEEWYMKEFYEEEAA